MSVIPGRRGLAGARMNQLPARPFTATSPRDGRPVTREAGA